MRDFEAEKAELREQIRKASLDLSHALFDLFRWAYDGDNSEVKHVMANFITAAEEKHRVVTALHRQYEEVVFWQFYKTVPHEATDCETVQCLHEDTHEMYHDPITRKDMWINTAYADDDIDDIVNKSMGI